MPLQPVIEMSRFANRLRDIDWSFFFCCFPQELNGDQSDADVVQVTDPHAADQHQSSGRSVRRRHTKGPMQAESTFGIEGLQSATAHHSKNDKEVVIFQTPRLQRHKSVQQVKANNEKTIKPSVISSIKV